MNQSNHRSILWIVLSLAVTVETSWSYLGCYKDSSTDRVLPYELYKNIDDLTPEKCQRGCEDLGYVYSATQYSRYCFCGGLYDDFARFGVCNGENCCKYNCSGNEDVDCGGKSQNSVYGKVLLGKELGCYADEPNDRALPILLSDQFPTSTLTIEMCMNECFMRGYEYAGVQIASYCFCGGRQDRYDRFGKCSDNGDCEDECSRGCVGDNSQLCGGVSANRVFAKSWKYIGCFQDDAADKILSHHLHIADDLSIYSCTSECFRQGFWYAGLQNGGECHCGKWSENIRKHGPCEMTGCACDVPCSGNSHQTCGGEQASDIYETALGWKYEGCYNDDNDDPAFPVEITQYSKMTPHICTSECLDQGYTFAGLQNKERCFCGDWGQDYSKHGECDGCCDKPCSGDITETCGNVDANSVYEKVHHEGCYRHEPSNPGLPDEMVHMDAEAMRVGKCVRECARHNYIHAGLYNGDSCFCGGAYDDYTLSGSCDAGDCSCDLPCTDGNQEPYCGGSSAISVFRILGSQENYIGCFEDTYFKPPEHESDSRTGTNHGCALQCLTSGDFEYAGIQKMECICGEQNDINDNTQRCYSGSDCKCDMSCSANTNMTCGGTTSRGVTHYGCPSGAFSYQCEKDCHCLDKECDFLDGRCFSTNPDCDYGWTMSPFCQTACSRGSYGINCKETCHCLNGANVCNTTRGQCEDGLCDYGFRDDPEDQHGYHCGGVCLKGSYGINCNETCHCLNGDSVCNTTRGQCEDGLCDYGFQDDPEDQHGYQCGGVCLKGSYGINCKETCHCLNGDSVCNTTRGQCEDGLCDYGFWDDPEDQHEYHCGGKCPSGRFGHNCGNVCNCANNITCDREKGRCEDGMCAPGYEDDTEDTTHAYHCLKECSLGKFGSNCLQSCNCDVESGEDNHCNITTGDCGLLGCAPGYEGINCLTLSAGGDDTGMIVGIVLGLIAILVLVFLIFIVFTKRRNTKPFGLHQMLPFLTSKSQNSDDPGVDNHGFTGEVNETIYENTAPTVLHSNRLLLSKLEDYVTTMKKQENPFEEEFTSLPKDLQAKAELGQRKEHAKAKNRFTNIIAYDHNAVKLKRLGDDELTEYINATHINSYKKPNEFIAAQGPTKTMMNDFWRMIWEQNCTLIVMVTQLVENGKKKCERYWPEKIGDKVTYGEFEVTLQSEEQKPDSVIRSLRVSLDNESKQVKQMNFTGWPDHGVPDFANTMIDFREKVRQEMKQPTGPVTVHCSAGVGRTGTFIALDYLLQQAEKEQAVDVYSCAHKLRADRVNMIQTIDQYTFVYDALVEFTTVGVTSIPCFKFTETLQKLSQPLPPKHISKLQEQFRVLATSGNKLSEADFEAGKEPENLPKNRFAELIPPNKNRVYLMLEAKQQGSYINAVFVNSYKKADAFIATQLPLPDYSADIWRMVHDYGVSCIISIADPTNVEDGLMYWPGPDDPLDNGPFHITCNAMDQDQHITEYDIGFTLKAKISRDIKLFQLNWSTERGLPGPTTDLFLLYDKMRRWQQLHQQGDRPILVQCFDGVDKCGVFCAVSSLIDMINTQQEVNVFQTVKQLRSSRPQFITEEQYRYLYHVAGAYMETFETYANFR